MKIKILSKLSPIALSTLFINPFCLVSCNKNEFNVIVNDKYGYIISLQKPFFEFTINFKGLVEGDVIHSEITKSTSNKVKIDEDYRIYTITSEDETNGYFKLKIIPTNSSPDQDVFTDTFSIEFNALHDGKVCITKTIDSFTMDAALPTEASYLDYETFTPPGGEELIRITGFKEDYIDDLKRCGILIIPRTIEGKSVDSIAADAFNCVSGDKATINTEVFKSIKWLLLDEPKDGETTLRLIGQQAFYGCPLTGALYIPKSVKEIWNEAFYDCKGFTELKFLDENNNLSQIYASAFAGAQFYGDLSIPKSTNYTEIKENVFGKTTSSSPKNIDKIIIPKNIKTIRKTAFDGYSNVTTIDLSDYELVPATGDWEANAFSNFGDEGVIYVRNKNTKELWTEFFNAVIENGRVFPKFDGVKWKIEVVKK